jgi:nucleotide-binding universal stress UspA family protein
MPVEPMPAVAVGLDGSAASFAALDLAAEEAAGRVTPLEIVHVYQGPEGSTVEGAAALARAGEMLAVAIGRVGADHPGLAVRGVFLLGDPAEALRRHTASACLAVVGYRGCGGELAGPHTERRGSRPVGPVAMRVASRSAVPVIVSRPFDREHTDAVPRAVLLGVDGLPCSAAAVAFAFEEAALRGAPIEVHHVWWQPPGAGIACCFPEAFYVDGADLGHARREARRMLADMLDTWSVTFRDVQVRRVVSDAGDVVAALLAASHDAQLVVAGAHEHAGLAHLLSCTVSQALIEQAGCSVAVTQSS